MFIYVRRLCLWFVLTINIFYVFYGSYYICYLLTHTLPIFLSNVGSATLTLILVARIIVPHESEDWSVLIGLEDVMTTLFYVFLLSHGLFHELCT